MKKARKKVKLMRPRDARTFDQVCALPRDNLTVGDFWIMLNGTGDNSVSICAQKEGQNVTANVDIPRRVFDRMVDWYMNPIRVIE